MGGRADAYVYKRRELRLFYVRETRVERRGEKAERRRGESRRREAKGRRRKKAGNGLARITTLIVWILWVSCGQIGAVYWTAGLAQAPVGGSRHVSLFRLAYSVLSNEAMEYRGLNTTTRWSEIRPCTNRLVLSVVYGCQILLEPWRGVSDQLDSKTTSDSPRGCVQRRLVLVFVFSSIATTSPSLPKRCLPDFTDVSTVWEVYIRATL